MFENENSQKYNTWTGVGLTIVVIIVCITIGFLFGKDIYERKHATVT